MKKIKVLVLFATMQAFAAYASVVTIFDNVKYTGAKQDLAPGKYDLAALKIGGDKARSVKVPNGYRVTLYADQGYKGTAVTLTADTPTLAANIDKLTSSIVVEKLHCADTPVTLYNGKNFTGHGQNFGVGHHTHVTMNLLVGDNKVQSAKVNPGFKVILTEHPNLGGKRLEFDKDTPDIGNPGDGISCVVVEKKFPSESEVTLCEDPEFKGTSKELPSEMTVIKAQSIGLKKVSSLFAPKGVTVTIREDNGEWGSYILSVSGRDEMVKLSNVSPITVTPQTTIIIGKRPS
jgi:hypothetical protein